MENKFSMPVTDALFPKGSLMSGLFGSDSVIQHDKTKILRGLLNFYIERITCYLNKRNGFYFKVGSYDFLNYQTLLYNYFHEMINNHEYDKVQLVINEAIYV